MKSFIAVRAGVLLGLFAIGCGSSEVPVTPTPTTATPAVAKDLLLTAEPQDAKGVIETRENAKDGDDVVIEGRIGGDHNPWVEGRAAFLIVDRSLVPCNERAGDNCPTPWDYCCDSATLPKSKATIKVVDDEGKTIPTDARQLLGIKELQTVVVKGRAKRDDEGNLTVLASALYVKPASTPKSDEPTK